jgi:hypothetical protein
VVLGGAAIYAANGSDHVGPILTFAGALIVAVITWISTDRRQARQLADQQARDVARQADERERLDHQLQAEKARLDAQLSAELERQGAALAHDRSLADVHDLRTLLNEAAVLLHEASYAGMDARSAFTSHGKSVHEKAPDKVHAVVAAGRDLDQMAARLSVRLGQHDRLAQTFDAANRWLLTFLRSLGQVVFDEPGMTAERARSLAEALAGFEGYRDYWRQVAADRVGAVMPDFTDPPPPEELRQPPPGAMPVINRKPPNQDDDSG